MVLSYTLWVNNPQRDAIGSVLMEQKIQAELLAGPLFVRQSCDEYKRWHALAIAMNTI